jgi:reverse gyrase
MQKSIKNEQLEPPPPFSWETIIKTAKKTYKVKQNEKMKEMEK